MWIIVAFLVGIAAGVIAESIFESSGTYDLGGWVVLVCVVAAISIVVGSKFF
jgi:hypothetical protein